MTEPVLELRGIAAGYGDRVVIDDVDLVVRQGEFVALVGGNGSGKSTLLKVVAGMLGPFRGEVRVFGGPPGASRRAAYLPQAEQLRWDYPLRVRDVVLLGLAGRLGLGRRPGAAERRAADAALERVAAVHLARRPVSDLSGGERQRVLLARTLVSDPDLLLLDEPATGVDPATEEDLMTLLGTLAEGGRTVVVSTHDLAGVLAHFERVVCMNRGIVADGGVEILRDDAILRRTYGGHRIEIALVGDDHHD